MTLPYVLQISSPELTVGVGALVLLVFGAFAGPKGTTLVSILSGLVLIAAAAVAAISPLGAAFHGGFVEDQASVFAKVAIYLMSAVAILLGDRWLHRLKSGRFEFPILILLAALGMGMMVSAGDLISLYISVELQSLALYVLCAFRRDDAKSSEAGLKYFVLGALSLGPAALRRLADLRVRRFHPLRRHRPCRLDQPEHRGDLRHRIPDLRPRPSRFPPRPSTCGRRTSTRARRPRWWRSWRRRPSWRPWCCSPRAMVLGFPDAVDQWRQVIVVIAAISMRRGRLRRPRAEEFEAPDRLFLDPEHRLRPDGPDRRGAGGRAGHAGVHGALHDRRHRRLRLPHRAQPGRQADGDVRRHAGLAKERPGIALALTRLQLLPDGHPAVLGLLGQVLRLQGGPGGGAMADRGVRPGHQRGGRLLLPAPGQDHVVRPGARPDRRPRQVRPRHRRRGGVCSPSRW